MKRSIFLFTASAVAVMTGFMPVSAAAQSQVLPEVRLHSLVTGAKSSEHKMYTVSLADGLYDITVAANGQQAVRNGSHVVVRSGTASVQVDDVERSGFSRSSATATLQISGGKASVYVKLGADKLYSSDRTVTFHKTATVRQAQPTSRPTELPRTGIEPMAIAAGGLVIGYGGHLLGQRRRPQN